MNVETEAPAVEIEAEAPPPEQDEQPEVDDQQEGEQPEAAADELVVQIGDDAPPPEEEEQRAPDWVRDLRKSHRELAKRNRELEEQVRAQQPAQAAPTLGTKPTLEGCDYDADKFESELAAWFDRKRQFDAEQQRVQQEQENQQKSWQERLNRYQQGKAALKVRDFDEAEAIVEQTLNVTQQSVVVQGAENPELVIYALGKNPKKAKELAAISDPVKFAFAVAKLEAQLKVTNRPKPPAPPRVVTGSAPISGSVDSNLERLRAEAEKTGDMTKVLRYKQQLRAKGK
jgi:hypothetical protein